MKYLAIILIALAFTGCTQSRTLTEWHDNHPVAGQTGLVNNKDGTTTHTLVFPFYYTHTGHPSGAMKVTEVTEMHQAVITVDKQDNIIDYKRTVVDWGR